MTKNQQFKTSTSVLTRRHFLRGAGVTLALPVLECRAQIKPISAGKDSAPQRMLLISNNLGVLPGPFFPKTSGADYQLSPYLKELKTYANDFTVFSGLSHPACEGGHSTENCFLTGARHPTSSGFRNTISLDQYAAEHLGRQTRFATLNLGVNIDKANRSLSWTRDGVLLPAEDSPAHLFRKMFIQGSDAKVKQRLQALKRRESILDAVSDSTQQYSRALGQNDRRRLDQYFTSIRELEQRLVTSGEWEQNPKPKVDQQLPQDIVDRGLLFDKFEQMLMMAALALQSDSTRIVTLMVDAFATPVFQLQEDEKSSTGYHPLSHHGMRPDHLAQLEKADRRQMSLLLQLFERLTEVQAESGRLLDSTMVLYGSNMGDANTHDNTNLPVLLAGGGFRHGQHLAFNREQNSPLCNLYVSMLQQLGVESDQFGSSSGTLTGLKS
ncbi:DUF1552 domain-containing protein [Gimesia maris]|uniref:DUF1552 domain-containing protein n=1 Tax=Gimesia maris TaxID=122 RepID=A0ABX5YS18_9PLAN|nr:DUF1552 domain-containing protein [Gimesia maris]EDL62137.1 hypothetical protein PM8797T_22798 [Gimesia maris DSM 8797]QEG18327.1 hypothetical protein GmarT_42130 [Gimesia maris]QGQ28689.1 DUF1552 domain-containing protein [Gimesia maris]